MMRIAVAALLLVQSLVPLAAVAAQLARGTISERGTGAAIPGALVSLVDESGRTISTVFSDQQGGFEMSAPSAGRYSIDVKRIGVRQLRGMQFTLAAGESRRENVVLSPVVSELTGVQVSGSSKCVSRPRDDARTAALWEDARAALTATVLTARRPLAGTITRFVRELSPRNDRVLRDERSEMHGNVSRPFVSVPVGELSREGYVVRRKDGSTDFYAPDAEALLSDEFLADHCFRFVAGSKDRAGMMGLGFEPVRGRRVPDIQGVLWLSAITYELTQMEFTYVTPSNRDLGRSFGGEVRFVRLPTGRWIVGSWVIRMPVVGVRPAVRMTLPGGMPMSEESREVLVAVREEGGAVRLDRAAPPPRKAVRGVVFDSSTGRAAAGARISIEGTGVSALAGPDGRFEIPAVPQGLYSVVVATPALDSLGASGPADTVRLTAAGGADLALAIPSRATLAARMCPGRSNDDPGRGAAVRVIVLDSLAGRPLGEGSARLWWRRFTGALSTRDLAEHVDGFIVRLDSLGSFTACDLPADELLHIGSLRDSLPVWSDTLRVAPREVGWRVLRVRSSTPPVQRP